MGCSGFLQCTLEPASDVDPHWGQRIWVRSPTWAAVFALLATVLPPTHRASKIDDDIDQYAKLAGEFTNLRDRFRQSALVASQKSFTDFDSEVRGLFERLEKARSRVLTPPDWCFKIARKKHKAGHYDFDYDQRSG